jgi:hypothetical protein
VPPVSALALNVNPKAAREVMMSDAHIVVSDNAVVGVSNVQVSRGSKESYWLRLADDSGLSVPC